MILAILVGFFNNLYATPPLFPNSLSLPVLITFANGGSGSGFFIKGSNHVFLATARHVLFDKISGKLNNNQADLSWYSVEGTNQIHGQISLNLGELATNGEIRINNAHDVAVVRFALVLTNGTTWVCDPRFAKIVNAARLYWTDKDSDNFRRLKDVGIGDDVYVFGYPSSIGIKELPEFDYSKPLLRKGIVSGIYDKTQTIIIDAAVYFGNSGGPVLEKNNMALGGGQMWAIGIVTDFIPFIDAGKLHYDVSNSGYAVVEPIDSILDLLWDN